MNDTWHSNTELRQTYIDTRNKILISNSLNYFSEGEKQIICEMKNNLNETIKELEKRTIYEPNALSYEQIESLDLTAQQKKIALGRLENKSYKAIAKDLNIRTNDVFKSYKRILKKAKKQKKLNLSDQESKVLFMLQQGKGRKKIARELNITPDTVKVYIKRIKAKGGGTN